MSTIIKPAFTSDPTEDNYTVFGPSGFLELSSHAHPEGGASQLELLLLERSGAVTLALSKDDGPTINLTKAEWEELKLHGDELWDNGTN